MSPPRHAVVVVAAGSGDRLGVGRPKALVELGGRPLLAHALEGVRQAGVDELVVVHPPEARDPIARVCAPYDVDALVAGGATRTDSVRAGVEALSAAVTVAAVHDAARPLTPAALIREVLDAVDGSVIAAAPGQPVADTLKQVHDAEVVATRPRDGLAAVATPQAFRRDALDTALAWAVGRRASDDLALIEQARAAGAVQGRIVLVTGSPLGLKITWPQDLSVAAALLAHRERTP